MPADPSAERVVQDVRLLLSAVRDEIAEGRRPYISDIRRLVERALALRYAEYVQFLEKYGFMTLDRRSNMLALTRAGSEIAAGDIARSRALAGDARYHFGDRMPAADAERAVAIRSERIDKRFLKLEALGRGGLGTVYAGRLLSVDRPVAIKLMEGLDELFRPEQHDEIRRRLELAVREHARLVSPFIVQILDQNPQHTPPYFVMELAPGGHLRTLLANGPLPPMVAMRYFVQIATALQTAHAAGVLHRDLKPENVLLDACGNIKLSDFGIIRAVEQDGARVRQAYVGYGSVGYMAPETFRPGTELGPQADIYALGILLYEMLVGELPGRRSPMPSEVVEGVPADLDEIFDRMTQDQVHRRPESLDELMESVWSSPEIVALFDARQPPMFAHPPVPLPGLTKAEPTPPEDPAESETVNASPASEAPPAPAPVETQTEPPVSAQPEPAEPEPMFAADPEPVYAEPEPAYEPEPIYAEPEPIYAEPEPIYAEPEPAYAAEPEPAFAAEPEPAFAAEPEPAFAAEPEAAFAAEPEPAFAAEPEPGFASEPAYAELAAEDPFEPSSNAPAPASAPPAALAIPVVVGTPAPDAVADDEIIEELDAGAFIEMDDTPDGPDPRSSTRVTKMAVESATRKAIDEKLRRLRVRT
jgi:serine/threonine protein kinase